MSRWRTKYTRTAAMRVRGNFHLLYRSGCTCRFCASMRQVRELDEINRGLAEAAASGDEIWYDRILRERGDL